MTIIESTDKYEAWLARELTIVPEDLQQKHELMKQGVFPFMRATFYRWAQLWPEVCPEFQTAPAVLAVGDLHVENFGTWRDTEGRLIWGINDFDEVYEMPWAIDLVRLAASAHMAINAGHLNIAHHEACAAIAAGYKEGLEAGGRPWVLGERHPWLSELVNIPAPAAFWEKFHALPDFAGKIPKEAVKGIERMLPAKDLKYRIAHRAAGLGSRGRERYVAIAEYAGGSVCREAKALAPSGWEWAQGGKESRRIRYQEALDTSVRAVDPFVRLKDRWIVRRLAPDCTRIELVSVPKEKEKTRLLQAMGWETANVHIGSRKTKAILRDLSKRPKHWLHNAATRMVKATTSDWKTWSKPEPKEPVRK